MHKLIRFIAWSQLFVIESAQVGDDPLFANGPSMGKVPPAGRFQLENASGAGKRLLLPDKFLRSLPMSSKSTEHFAIV